MWAIRAVWADHTVHVAMIERLGFRGFAFVEVRMTMGRPSHHRPSMVKKLAGVPSG